jgi:hypothetical protein
MSYRREAGSENLLKAEGLSQSAAQAIQARAYTDAHQYIKDALILLKGREDSPSQVQISKLYCQLGAVHIERGQWTEAEQSLKSSLQLSRILKFFSLSVEA